MPNELSEAALEREETLKFSLVLGAELKLSLVPGALGDKPNLSLSAAEGATLELSLVAGEAWAQAN